MAPHEAETRQLHDLDHVPALMSIFLEPGPKRRNRIRDRGVSGNAEDDTRFRMINESNLDPCAPAVSVDAVHLNDVRRRSVDNPTFVELFKPAVRSRWRASSIRT